MAERRPLTEGLKQLPPIDPEREKAFVYGAKAPTDNGATASVQSSNQTVNLRRVPISTRIRGDFAEALKNASLKRQLDKVEPNTLQDILEEAIEPWLKNNGYLP